VALMIGGIGGDEHHAGVGLLNGRRRLGCAKLWARPSEYSFAIFVEAVVLTAIGGLVGLAIANWPVF